MPRQDIPDFFKLIGVYAAPAYGVCVKPAYCGTSIFITYMGYGMNIFNELTSLGLPNDYDLPFMELRG